MQNTPAGAEAFVRFFWENFNHAMQYPSAGAISRLCDAGSKSCADLEGRITKLLSLEYHAAGPFVALTSVSTHDVSPGETNILFSIKESPVDVIGKNGDIVDRLRHDKESEFVMTIKFINGTWVSMKSQVALR